MKPPGAKVSKPAKEWSSRGVCDGPAGSEVRTPTTWAGLAQAWGEGVLERGGGRSGLAAGGVRKAGGVP